MNFYFDLIKQFAKKYLFKIFTGLMLGSICILNIYHIFFQDKITSCKNTQDSTFLVEKEATSTNADSSDNSQAFPANSNEDKKEELAKIFIDIKGSVKNPGVYQVDIDNIVNDCIKKAGGLLKNADTTTINLSKKVSSEMVIYIPKKDEVVKTTNSTTVTKNQEIPNDAAISNNNTDSKDSSSANDQSNTLIDINTATTAELAKLNGIGTAKAQDIIDYRTKNGSFKTIEDIKNVSGIGDALYAKIKDYITV